MRDTVWSILLPQIPIAIACLWVAIELRGIRKGIESIARSVERLPTDATDGNGPPAGG